MVVPRLQWPQLPSWMSLTGSRKRALEEDDEEVQEEKMEVVEKTKQQLVEALAARGAAMVECGMADKDNLLDIYTDIVKYVDLSDSKVKYFTNHNSNTTDLYHSRSSRLCGSCSSSWSCTRRL